MHWGGYYATAVDIEVDPQRRRFGRRESDFALQRLEECRLGNWLESGVLRTTRDDICGVLRTWREVVKDGVAPDLCTADLVAFLRR